MGAVDRKEEPHRDAGGSDVLSVDCCMTFGLLMLLLFCTGSALLRGWSPFVLCLEFVRKTHPVRAPACVPACVRACLPA